MKSQEKIRKDWFILVILYLCYFVALLIASSFTSPLYTHYYGDDAALFSLLGKGVVQGKILYTDLFDHKGPIIFFINALGHMLGGYKGIFFLQCVAGGISLTFLFYIAKMLNPNPKTIWEYILLFACAYIVFFYTFERGNLTEEYSQPFISAALYFFVKFAVRSDEITRHPPLYAFIYGVAFAVLAFLRLNNAVTICAGIMSIFLFLLHKKEYKNLLLNLIAGCVGIALVAVPICLYFQYHSALYEMIYATFLYNFNIVGDSGRQEFLDYIVKFSVLFFPIIICGILLCAYVIRKRTITFLDALLGCILLCNVIIFNLANRYPHYFAIFVPVYLVFLLRYFRIEKKKIVPYLIATCTVVNLLHIGYYTAVTVYSCHFTNKAEIRYNLVQDAIAVIPESEQDSVIGYQIPVSYYILGDIIPCYKYYTWQESWGKINNQVVPDFMEWVSTEKPLWVLTTPQEDNPDLTRILHQEYELMLENELLIAYRLCDGQ